MLKKQLALAVAAAVMTTAAFADDSTWEVGAGGSYYFYDSDRNIEDDPGFNLWLGRKINEFWSIEGVYSTNDTDFDGSSVDIDGRQLRLDGLYHFANEGDWKPYVVAGVGEQKWKALGMREDETMVNVGVGVKHNLTHDWQFRTDARLFNSLDNEFSDIVVSAGLSYLFGAPKKAPVQDDDGDGVVNSQDNCPNTPKGVAVNALGCPLDSDGDGVYDYKDQCPDTEAGLKVDEVGCPMTLTDTVSIKLEVHFDFDSAVVKPAYMSEIRDLAEFMGQYLNTEVTVEGHTDSLGDAAYNQKLSQRRADAVRKVLIEQFDIESDRVKAIGFGESNPVATNDTKAGRLENRRVMAQVSSKVERKVQK